MTLGTVQKRKPEGGGKELTLIKRTYFEKHSARCVTLPLTVIL